MKISQSTLVLGGFLQIFVFLFYLAFLKKVSGDAFEVLLRML